MVKTLKTSKKFGEFRSVASIQSQEKGVDHASVYKTLTTPQSVVSQPPGQQVTANAQRAVVAAHEVPAPVSPEVKVAAGQISQTYPVYKKLGDQGVGDGAYFIWYCEAGKTQGGMIGRLNKNASAAEVVLPQQAAAASHRAQVFFNNGKGLLAGLKYTHQQNQAGATGYRYEISSLE
ncbi:MAG: hypothetical protein HQM16_14070 [Deltaproteobacteria bacterium]|nr:hypothetical protein [Deltaproteobacteria bacterium]